MVGGRNGSWVPGMTYLNTSPVRTLTYNYNGTTLDNSISRLTSITDGATTLETYTYLGLATVVKRGHPEPGVDLTYIAQTGDPACTPGVPPCDGGDQYRGLDRFGRVVDQRWIPTSSPQSPTDRFQYTYDQDSNRLTRTNAVNTSFNETYTYDNFNQLTNFTRGSHSQSWTLDPLGNWTSFSDVTGGVVSTQSRGNNSQNQITSINGFPVQWYDANGNTTTDDHGKTLVYDAWNRLVQYKSGSTVLASYSYDALGRRIIENPGTTRDLYYSAAWQVVEERVGTNVQIQNVWSPVYVDALIERDRDPNQSGTLSERLYVQQDANFNVTAVVGYDTPSMSWKVQERYAYDPYGQPTFLDPNTWATLANSAFAWLYLHQGGRRDTTTGLYNFGMRDYSPTLGRWMQQDPIEYLAGDSNLYRYVSSQPTGLTDPSGLVPWWLSSDGTGGTRPQRRKRPGSSPKGGPRPPSRPKPWDPIDLPYVPGSSWIDLRTAYFDPDFTDNWKQGMGQTKVLRT